MRPWRNPSPLHSILAPFYSSQTEKPLFSLLLSPIFKGLVCSTKKMIHETSHSIDTSHHAKQTRPSRYSLPIHNSHHLDSRKPFSSKSSFFACSETTMALLLEEALLKLGLLDGARSGDLVRMKESAEMLDHGEGLVETYSKYRGSAGQTALHYAATRGKIQICKYLIEAVGLDVNIQDWHGETALINACMSSNHQTMAYLIKKGANVNLPNHDGFVAIHNAAHEGLNDILRLLISNGADVEAPSQSGTPLYMAASRGNKEAVKILLDNKANPNAASLDIFTPLLVSIHSQLHECINLLLKAGADPDLAVNGVTPLEMAVNQEDTEAIKCLLKAGANPNVTSFEGMTPLEISAFNHYHEGVKILLPKTSPLSSIPDWTFRGIITAVHSQEATYQREQKKKCSFMEAKARGAEAFKKKNYLVALYWYNMALQCDPLEATVFSNRSLCWARLDDGTKALDDAEACIELKPDWSKAHYRKGVACEILKDFRGAAEAYAFALKLEPGNDEIRTALRNVQAL